MGGGSNKNWLRGARRWKHFPAPGGRGRVGLVPGVTKRGIEGVWIGELYLGCKCCGCLGKCEGKTVPLVQLDWQGGHE